MVGNEVRKVAEGQVIMALCQATMSWSPKIVAFIPIGLS